LRACALLCALALVPACRESQPPPPPPDSDDYRNAISAFYVGLAALETGDFVRADEKLAQITQIAPNEPAGWANHGLLALRQNELDAASQRLQKAHELAPENPAILMLQGILESTRGKFDVAIERYKQVADLDKNALKARYSLAQEIERQGGPNADAETLKIYNGILDVQPNNLATLLEVARLAAKSGDGAALRTSVERIGGMAAGWPPEVLQSVEAARSAASSDAPTAASRPVTILRNVLLRTPEYRASVAEVKDPTGTVGEPLSLPLWHPVPIPTPAPLDETLRFVAEPIPDAPAGPWSLASSAVLAADAAPTVVVATGTRVRVGPKVELAFPGTDAAPPGPHGILAFDASYDFRTDLLFAGAAGLKYYVQGEDGGFTDATARMGLPTGLTGGSLAGAWAADLESDGDLDVILAPTEGAPIGLTNNGNGTFAQTSPFPGVASLRDVAWGDFDGDGDGDPALVDGAGSVHLFLNERLGIFRAEPALGSVSANAVAVADVDRDGVLDLLALQPSGAVVRVSSTKEGAEWKQIEVVRLDGPASGAARLFAADLDNNGGVDLVATTDGASRALLCDPQGAYKAVGALPTERPLDIADVTGDGRLDLVCVSGDGAVVRATNRGTQNYGWIELRPRAKETTGDQRVNPFGIGGELELRSGLLAQKLPIARALVHFGLGTYTNADVARVVWPNGSVQAEFSLDGGRTIAFDQRLEGSCPWLFAWDGSAMRFVTDVIWRSPLGLRINAQDTGRVTQTEDWVKLRADQLAARDGFYDLRITAELWETHFFDHTSLMAVDHPAGTEIFVDERFAIPPPALAVHATGPAHPVATAVDDAGTDVTEIVRARDGRYLDTFGRGQYQGVTRDHFVEIDLEDAPASRPLWLVAGGWLHPTDSSINVALAQNGANPPRGLTLEVADGAGGWTEVGPSLGFPAGKLKTILVPLDGVFKPGAPRRVRLRTNLEIYWDSIAWAEGIETKVDPVRIDAATAELRYRGFSLVSQADKSSPELPDYDRIVSTVQRWPDLIGYHTRFGDVRPLLQKVDDRYVIMNAGDELLLRFPAIPPPAEGMIRDFVFVSDGWEKDGNFNTTYSKTVLPLPLHDQPEYDRPPGRLEDDPAYRRHPEDWQEYHTRYVTPRPLKSALWSNASTTPRTVPSAGTSRTGG